MANEMKDTRPRPSTLPMLAACPRFVPRPKDRAKKDSLDEAADEGTLLHAKMEALAEIPVAEWDAAIAGDPDLAPHQVPLLLECAAQVRDLFGLGLPVVTKRRLRMDASDHYQLRNDPPGSVQASVAAWRATPEERAAVWGLWSGVHDGLDGVYCEVSADPGVCRPGTADVFAKFGNKGVLCDYKFTRVTRESGHSAQMYAYVLGFFDVCPSVDYIEVRIVAPRLGDEYPAETFSRKDDLPRIRAEIEGIVAAAARPFESGCPGDQCCFCEGNGGGCPYQAATLRDIPVDETALVMPGVWVGVMAAATVEARGQRKRITRWLKAFIEASDEDDKAWAKDNPQLELPGFTKSVSMGRASLDRDRLAEANQALLLRFGLTPSALLGYAVPDKDRLAEFVAMAQAMTEADAKSEINRALTPFVKRGDDIVSFRAVKAKKAAIEK